MNNTNDQKLDNPQSVQPNNQISKPQPQPKPPKDLYDLRRYADYIFMEQYGAQWDDIGHQLFNFYKNDDFEWKEVKDDIQQDDIASCSGIDIIIKSLKLLNKSNVEKQKAFKCLKSCLEPHIIPIYIVSSKLQNLIKTNSNNFIQSSIYAKNKKTAHQLLSTFCSNIYVSEHHDKSLHIAKSLDIINNKAILLLFIDTFCRIRMKEYYNNNIDKYTVTHFFDEYSNEIKKLLSSNAFVIDILQKGMNSYLTRITPKMTLKLPGYTICDSLNHYASYTVGCCNFITQNIMNNNFGTVQVKLPQQFDVIIIPQSVRNEGIRSTQVGPSFYDKDDDDDDDDDDYGNDDNKNEYAWMGYGGNNHNNRPITEIKNIETCLKNCGYIENVDYICDEIEPSTINSFNIQRVVHTMNNKLIPHSPDIRYKRTIVIIDRRNPDDYNGNSIHVPSYPLDDKSSYDLVYCIRPKKHCCITKYYETIPESFFCLSQEFVIPPNIGIKQSLNGYMFLLSFHIYSSNKVRTYFGCNGQIQRFDISDVEKFWPKLFIKIDNDYNCKDDQYTSYIPQDINQQNISQQDINLQDVNQQNNTQNNDNNNRKILIEQIVDKDIINQCRPFEDNDFAKFMDDFIL